MSDEGAQPKQPRRRKRLGRRLMRLTLLLLGPLGLAAAGGYYYMISARYVSTENAYVKMDKIAISADVSGHVAEVVVNENDFVRAGKVLFRLDDARYGIAMARAEAELVAARQEVETLRALYRQKLAELELASHDSQYFKSELKRATDLRKKGHASQAKLDKAQRDWLTAKQKIVAIRQDIAGVVAQLGGNVKLPAEEHPRVLEAHAERNRAMLDLERTVVVAPEDGIVSAIELQPGEYVEEGEPIFSIVSVSPLWVEANLKETDLTHVREGQKANVYVDAYPDHVWPAAISSIAAATGAEFALLPPQNASGNWVKVVQRIPVHLVLEQQLDDPPLRAGMSVRVEIDTHHERDLPGFVQSALGWARGQR